jgi:aryl-alcohol dehydrogenase-like predicted oxidoreductase
MVFSSAVRVPSRRAFVRMAAGTASLSILGNRLAIGQSASSVATRAVPKSNEQLPVIGLGTDDFLVQPEAAGREKLKLVVDNLLVADCKIIDTASSYGASENILGDLLSDQERSKVFLATKVENGSSAGGLAELRRSLERLRYRQVDLVQQHNVSNPHQDLAPFRDWKAQGLCRYIGITTTYKQEYEAAEAVIEREKPDFFEVDYSLADRTAEARLLPAARDVGAAVLIALPFGHSSVFTAVRGKSVPNWASEFGATTWAQFFLKFVLGHDAVTAAIPGTTNSAHLADNISAGHGPFPDAKQRKAMIDFFSAL